MGYNLSFRKRLRKIPDFQNISRTKYTIIECLMHNRDLKIPKLWKEPKNKQTNPASYD